MAMVLALSAGIAAEPKTAPLVGATREQVLERLGEPRSSIVAGAREVLLFERERVILRNNVVVEVDLLPAEAPRRAAEPASDIPPSTDESVEPAPKAETAPTEKAAPRVTAPARGAATTPPAAAPAPDEGPLQIRAVRKAGAPPPPTPSKTESVTSPAVSTPTPSPTAPVAPPASGVSAPAVAPPAVPPVTSSPLASEPVAPAPESRAANAAAAKDSDETRPAAKPADTTTKKKAPRARRDPAEPEAEPELFTGRSYLIAFVIVAGGIGFLVWRSRQRTLELAATAVSRTPFAPPPTTVAGAKFSPELLSKLEWKRFEELIAAYYGKTGVVAVRTKTGPASPVHIKISWKGESRPFAYVQCLANPTGLIDAKPIQELVAVLMAEDIRRGYVVTTGKFSVPARDFAEEKHITLLSGDILLEKLNALPDGARNELMQETTAGDYTTPSCPTCEAKMVKSPEDPNAWRCPNHPEVMLRTGA